METARFIMAALPLNRLLLTDTESRTHHQSVTHQPKSTEKAILKGAAGRFARANGGRYFHGSCELAASCKTWRCHFTATRNMPASAYRDAGRCGWPCQRDTADCCPFTKTSKKKLVSPDRHTATLPLHSVSEVRNRSDSSNIVSHLATSQCRIEIGGSISLVQGSIRRPTCHVVRKLRRALG